jgi:EPS-associated MarR family transcriptional regulator
MRNSAVKQRAQTSREDAHFRVMRLLEQDPNISQREMARELGVSLGATNYILRALVEHGFVKLGRFTASPTKGRYAYVLTPRGAAEKAAITGRFLARKIAEYEQLKREIEALRAEAGDGAAMSSGAQGGSSGDSGARGGGG